MYLSSYSIMVEKEIEIESPDECSVNSRHVVSSKCWKWPSEWRAKSDHLRIFITNLNTICDLFTIVWTDKSKLMALIFEVLEKRSSF